MFAVRSAILMLAVGLFPVPCTATSSASNEVAHGREGASGLLHVASSMPCQDSALRPHPRMVLRLAVKKVRVKAALVEETDRKFEEADLGPVPAPPERPLITTIALRFPRLPTTSRLRC
jgi:hypothetical protein